MYQFKITLRYVEPPIWRRIEVPGTYTFWDLHVAIQDAMGWSDYHLHQFELISPSTGARVEIGIPEDEIEYGGEILPGWEQKIAQWFSMENKFADYLYDFGDGWEHVVKLKRVGSRENKVSYPRCVNGERACPPEDCGGVPGYEEICLGESEFQEEYEDYDPEHFDVREVRFDDPDKRWRIAFK